MMFHNFQYLLGQQGSSSERKKSLQLPLRLDDLQSSGWREIGERSWRPGFSIPKDDISQRARATKEFTAIRFFEEKETTRGIWAQVSTFATEEDSIERVTNLNTRILDNPGRKIVSETYLEGSVVPGASRSTLFEQRSYGRGGEGIARYAGGNVGRFVFMIACTLFPADQKLELWPWIDVLSLAELQAKRIVQIRMEFDWN